ncbi:zinc finger protein BALDIBIS-like [Neltuma alba]|uniref:zinc finger protein BALDIBIS-like n=1 Tax=Neltuma alba TaxID=207710 RepID=UPI0010A565FA|nr:zinc finger protein BALDIBIS-like [Prosopis alba]
MSEQGLSLPSTIKTFLPHSTPNPTHSNPLKKRRNLPGTPDPDAKVIALSPKSLMATNRFVCEICKKGFQRDQNLQLHRRGHNLPWKLRQRSEKEAGKKVYVCPEKTCVHHDPSRALGDLTGIKKHYSRKHGEKKWNCDRCSKKYAVHSDWKAHIKICGTREYKCLCGTLFSRKDSFVTHRAFCDVLAEENARISFVPEAPRIPQIYPGYGGSSETLIQVNSSMPDLMQTMNMLPNSLSSSWVKPYPEASFESLANLAMSGASHRLLKEEEEENKGGLSYSASSLYCSNYQNPWQVGLAQPHHMSSPTSLLQKVNQMRSTGSNHVNIFGFMGGSLPSLSSSTSSFRNGDEAGLYFKNTANGTDDQSLNDLVTISKGNSNVGVGGDDCHGLVLNDSNSSHFVMRSRGENLDQMELGGLTRDFLGVGEKELAGFNAAGSVAQPWS